jgi:hypothetical protein
MNAVDLYDSLCANISDRTVYEAGEEGMWFDSYAEALIFSVIVRAKEDDLDMSEVAETVRMICANYI